MQDSRAWSARLLRHRNVDGGWGYAAGRASRIEPTCWALLAASRADGTAVDADVLVRWPRRDGWLVDVAGAPTNYAFNALAGLVLSAAPAGVDAARAIGRQLLDVRGLKLAQTAIIRQDNSLQAWPWNDGTFSWMEPTAFALLLLRKLQGSLALDETSARVAVGEAMLRDRACDAGGWNYGSAMVYGQALPAYVPTTALGILALQTTDDPIRQRAVQWLRANAASEPSAVALALARMALAIVDPPADVLDAALGRAIEAAGERSLLGLAMGAYAWAADNGELEVFRV
jgi:hypothetical protein